VPCRSPLGAFGDFWENLYTWWVMWAYHQVSVRHRQFFRLRRVEAWMPAEAFIQRFGGRPAAKPSGNQGEKGSTA
jgi:hypothetical protein